MSNPHKRLKHHVTGAIERGEKRAIAGITQNDKCRMFLESLKRLT